LLDRRVSSTYGVQSNSEVIECGGRAREFDHIGAAAAPLAIRGLIAFLPNELAANALRCTLSLRLLTFAFFASIAAGFLSGLAPALRARGDNLVNSLRERAGTGFGGVRLRQTIVTLQVAFSLILVVGAALFLRTLTGLLAKGPGFETSGLLSFAIAPLENGYSHAAASPSSSAPYPPPVPPLLPDLPSPPAAPGATK